jgi:N-dimethylarginine dimethylaminohydrolase
MSIAYSCAQSRAREANAHRSWLHEAGRDVVPKCRTVGGPTLADVGIGETERTHAACNSRTRDLT